MLCTVENILPLAREILHRLSKVHLCSRGGDVEIVRLHLSSCRRDVGDSSVVVEMHMILNWIFSVVVEM